MNDENLILDKYGKKYLLPVYSCSLAIEGILRSLKLKSTDKVLITNVVCHSILQSILNANLTPIIAIPNNGLTLSKEELKDIVKKENIKVFIAVHQYGYEQEIVKIKNLIIIEDIAQAWNIKLGNSYVGKYSDYIVTSLGKNKPLNNGIGGLIISDINFISKFDIKIKECRDSCDNVLEFFYPLDINYKRLVINGNKRIIKQRKNAKWFNKIFHKYNFIDLIDEGDSIPSYHRYLIYVSAQEYNKVISLLNKCKINYQKEYNNKLDSINLVKTHQIKVIGSNKVKKSLLLKTNNRFLNIKRLGMEMRKYYKS